MHDLFIIPTTPQSFKQTVFSLVFCVSCRINKELSRDSINRLVLLISTLFYKALTDIV
jgi:hypothetical protein